jgi:hypothetical protein
MLRIAFTTDKNGREIAYRVGKHMLNHYRTGLDEAKMLVATGQAQQVRYVPRHQYGCACHACVEAIVRP